MPLVFKDDYYKPVEKDLRNYFHELYWAGILELLEEPVYNSISELIAAIRKGTIQYKNGEFSGQFNASLSRELSKFARYDSRKKIWIGTPPPAISGAAAAANSRMQTLNQRITAQISAIPSMVSGGLPEMSYSIDLSVSRIGRIADKDVISLGMTPNQSPALTDKILREYKTNMDLNIVNWTDNQTERLRDMIERNVAAGYNRQELIRAIQSEYDTTMNKARFLARQETSLLMSKISEERYIGAGLQWYRWGTSNDARVVGNPSGLYPKGGKGHGDHYSLQGKICKLKDPTVYADSLEDARAGKWKSKIQAGMGNKHPGEDYQCRCVKIPVV